MTAVWAEEARADGVAFLAIDPGDMDTPLHALAVPDADRTTLKRVLHRNMLLEVDERTCYKFKGT